VASEVGSCSTTDAAQAVARHHQVGRGLDLAPHVHRRFFGKAVAHRHARGNAKRWADHIPTEVTKPWEAEGIHRATWYRSDRVNENGATRMDGERQRSSATIVLSDSSLLVGSAQTTAPLLVARRDCGGTQQLRVVVFRGELPKVVIARHMELRPEHRDRRIRLEYRNDTRNSCERAVCRP
jgi:hypothetical protein